MKEKISQQEYDNELIRLRNEMHEEYAAIDNQRVANNIEIESTRAQIYTLKERMNTLATAQSQLHIDKNEIARRYDEKRRELRQRRTESICINKELNSTVAYKLHRAVESALKLALSGRYPDVDCSRIKCNYNYDDDGNIEFNVIIPTYGEEND